MTTLKLSDRMCSKHHRPAVYICLNKECTDVACCTECPKSTHPHPKLLVDLREFSKSVVEVAAEKAAKLVVPCGQTLSTQKEEFEREQATVLEDIKQLMVLEKKAFNE